MTWEDLEYRQRLYYYQRQFTCIAMNGQNGNTQYGSSSNLVSQIKEPSSFFTWIWDLLLGLHIGRTLNICFLNAIRAKETELMGQLMSDLFAVWKYQWIVNLAIIL